jgi:hypothetical protein
MIPHFMTAILQLNCWVFGDDVQQLFCIEIPTTNPVSVLKDAIKNEKEPDLNHVAASSLTLWKVSIPISRYLQQSVAMVDLIDETSLSSVDNLVDVFSDALHRKHLHIVVQPHPSEWTSPELFYLSLIVSHVYSLSLNFSLRAVA